MQSDKQIYQLTEFFKVFANPTRIRIIMTLIKKPNICVGEISKTLGITQSAISHQMSILRSERLVKFKKDGKEVYYSLDDYHIEQILNLGVEHIEEL